MGNRAVITTRENFKTDGVGVYLHWNGGRDSVQAFLKYCELKGYRAPSTDNYGWARLAQVIGNFFGGSTSVGVDKVSHLDCDNWDNGTYIIDGWEIVGREYFEGHEQDEYDLQEMLIEIDNRQPKNEQLGDYITAEEVEISSLKIGDIVYMCDYDGKPELHTVVGFGAEGVWCNGHDVTGVPYVDKYSGCGEYCKNINNYLTNSNGMVKLGARKIVSPVEQFKKLLDWCSEHETVCGDLTAHNIELEAMYAILDQYK